MFTSIQDRGGSWRAGGKSAKPAHSGQPPGQNGSDVCQLFWCVDRKGLAGIEAGDRIDMFARLQQQPWTVGQVVLAGSVRCIELFKAGKQMFGRKDVGAHVHFANGSLSFRGIFLFRDLPKSTIFITNNAAQAGGIVSDCRPEQAGGVGLCEGIKKPRYACRPKQRRIAADNHDRPMGRGLIGACRPDEARRCCNSIAGATLLVLDGKLHTGTPPDRITNQFSSMTNHNDLVGASGCIKGVKHPADERFARCCVQYLGQVAPHASALSGGQHDSKR